MDWTGGDQAVVVYSSFDLKLRAFCFGVFNVCSNARMLGNYDNLNNARTRRHQAACQHLMTVSDLCILRTYNGGLIGEPQYMQTLSDCSTQGDYHACTTQCPHGAPQPFVDINASSAPSIWCYKACVIRFLCRKHVRKSFGGNHARSARG